MFRIESGIRQVLKKGYVNAKWFPLIKQAPPPPPPPPRPSTKEN